MMRTVLFLLASVLVGACVPEGPAVDLLKREQACTSGAFSIPLIYPCAEAQRRLGEFFVSNPDCLSYFRDSGANITCRTRDAGAPAEGGDL